MAHELHMTDGKASMAYVGETPWHGLGQSLTEGADIDVWKREAGMLYQIKSATLGAHAEGVKDPIAIPNKIALYRDDTNQVLGVVGNRYHVVQPEEVLEFFRDLTEERGFTLETAGVLFGGSKYWALARTPHHLTLEDDEIKEHLLLATACDGSMATTARYVRTRVVCNNTLEASFHEGSQGKIIRVEHRSAFKAGNVKRELKILEGSWNEFSDQVAKMSEVKVEFEQAAKFYIDLLGKPELPMDDQTSSLPAEMYNRFIEDRYIGSEMVAAKGTVWGLVNVITEDVDHHRGLIADRRLKSAWFGKGASLKSRAFEMASNLI